jgi:hypothetical protein
MVTDGAVSSTVSVPGSVAELPRLSVHRSEKVFEPSGVVLMSTYSGVANCDIVEGDRDWVFTYRHDLGERWSRFIAAYYGEFFTKVLGVEVTQDVSTNQIVLKWDISK